MFWKLKGAFHVFCQRLRRPLTRLEGSNWDGFDHDHICFAARLLGEKDFQKVCPIAKNSGKNVEWEDECDFCQYFGVIKFNSDEDGKKSVEFHIS